MFMKRFLFRSTVDFSIHILHESIYQIAAVAQWLLRNDGPDRHCERSEAIPRSLVLYQTHTESLPENPHQPF